MAVTPITTSAIDPLPGGINAYKPLDLAEMFLQGRGPHIQIANINVLAADAWTSNTFNTLLAAPGAAKALYVFGAEAFTNNTGLTVLANIVLAEGTSQGALPVIANSFGMVAVRTNGAPNAVLWGGGITRVGHQVTANTAIGGVWLSAVTALVKVRIFYCVVSV